MFTGPNTIKDGLVLHLDAANIKSFKGEPTTNLLTAINYSYGTVNGTYFKSNYGSEIVNIPNIAGSITANYCNIYNDYAGGSGNCCPPLFGFGNITVSPSTTYTYQIIFKTATGYYNSNYMYRYEYNTDTYITEGGFVDSSRMIQLGDGWVHAWGTFTTTSTTNRIIPNLFHYEYATQNKVQLAGIMLTQGTKIYEPKFFLPVNGSRGTTVATGGGLKDIAGNGNNGELLNGPFYSSTNNGSITFDGVNDNISIPYNTSMDPTNGITLEAWINPADITTAAYMEIFRKQSSPGLQLFSFQLNGTILSFGTDTTDYGYNELDVSINSTDYVNKWVHVVASYKSGNKSIYRNGVLIGTQSWIFGNLVQGIADYYIGSLGNYSEFFNGKIATFKQYNRGLSSAEVLQNYNATKSRFGL